MGLVFDAWAVTELLLSGAKELAFRICQAHGQRREDAEGYSYKHSNLQNRADQQSRHRYDNYDDG